MEIDNQQHKEYLNDFSAGKSFSHSTVRSIIDYTRRLSSCDTSNHLWLDGVYSISFGSSGRSMVLSFFFVRW